MFVQIRDNNGKVVHEIDCKNNNPDKVERGVLINLDHDNYHTTQSENREMKEDE